MDALAVRCVPLPGNNARAIPYRPGGFTIPLRAAPLRWGGGFLFPNVCKQLFYYITESILSVLFVGAVMSSSDKSH